MRRRAPDPLLLTLLLTVVAAVIWMALDLSGDAAFGLMSIVILIGVADMVWWEVQRGEPY